MRIILALALLVFTGQVVPTSADEQTAYDIVVYGDSSGAVTAAVAAKREGRSVILVNPVQFLDGLANGQIVHHE